jgi:hypothetical protein
VRLLRDLVVLRLSAVALIVLFHSSQRAALRKESDFVIAV